MPKAARQRRASVPAKIHRWIGLGSLLILVVISITGVLLNHTRELALDQKSVSSEWIQAHYGMSLQGDAQVYQDSDPFLASWQKELFVGDLVVDSGILDAFPIAMMSYHKEELLLLYPSAVVVLDSFGNLIDTMDDSLLSIGAFRRMGISTASNQLVVEGESGVITSSDLIAFEKFTDSVSSVTWSTKRAANAEEELRMKQAYRGEGISLYRVILDLHSGRFFGVIGVIVYDVAAVLLIVLGITGVQLWWRRRRPRSARRNAG